MNEKGSVIGENGELGAYSEREILKAAADLGKQEPEDIDRSFEIAAEAAKHDRENHVLLKLVRSTAEEMLDSFVLDPVNLDMLTDAYVGSVTQARVELGRSADEEGVRMMLGAAIKAIGDRRGTPNNDELVKKIAGSVEAVNVWFAANSPKKIEITDDDVDSMLSVLDANVSDKRAPSSAENRI